MIQWQGFTKKLTKQWGLHSFISSKPEFPINSHKLMYNSFQFVYNNVPLSLTTSGPPKRVSKDACYFEWLNKNGWCNSIPICYSKWGRSRSKDKGGKSLKIREVWKSNSRPWSWESLVREVDLLSFLAAVRLEIRSRSKALSLMLYVDVAKLFLSFWSFHRNLS